MAAADSLKRLGGGRWETRDGRFAIEPQSGTWVVVDNSQTDDLGLPLVRGPFGSLTAAKDAIETARGAGDVASPLADRIKQAASRKPGPVEAPAGRKQGRRGDPAKTSPPGEPEPPPEPRWLRDLKPADRRRAHDLIAKLDKLGIADSGEIAKAEITRDQPAIARLALERSLREVMASAKTPGDAVRATVKSIMGGSDRRLDVRWRLVDDQGRRVAELDLSD